MRTEHIPSVIILHLRKIQSLCSLLCGDERIRRLHRQVLFDFASLNNEKPFKSSTHTKQFACSSPRNEKWPKSKLELIFVSAETRGFEPPKAFTLLPFQGSALDRYATSPSIRTISYIDDLSNKKTLYPNVFSNRSIAPLKLT